MLIGRKRGFAQKMIQHVEEYAIQEGCSIMELDIISVRPQLLQFYGKFGYKATGETLEYPGVGTYGKVKIPFHMIVLNKVLF